MDSAVSWFRMTLLLTFVYWPISLALSIFLAIWGVCIKSRGWSTAFWLAAVTLVLLGLVGLFFGFEI